MMYPQKVISASLSPNAQRDDIWRSIHTLLVPWKWKNGTAIYEVEQWFCTYFNVPIAVSFNSGRSALLALITSFDIEEGDEVLVQAFTCVAVPNSILWAGAKPIYVDVDETLNMDVSDAAKKITKRTKAMIIQHTFGIPADMENLMAFAKKHKLIVIEDCAHSLGASYKGRKIGTFGDAAFFSFGRDKVISSVFGGMAVINSAKCGVQSAELNKYQEKLPYPSMFWILQQLFHPIAFAVILPLYTIGVGKLLLVILQKFRLLSFPVYPEEKRGKKPNDFPKKYPNALARLLLNQLAKLTQYNQTRKKIAQYYFSTISSRKDIRCSKPQEGAIYLRFPISVSNPQVVMEKAKKQGVLLGNWYHHTIDPAGTHVFSVGYKEGNCPNAEKIASQIINLPTRISSSDAQKVIRMI